MFNVYCRDSENFIHIFGQKQATDIQGFLGDYIFMMHPVCPCFTDLLKFRVTSLCAKTRDIS